MADDESGVSALSAALAFIPYAYKGPESGYNGGARFVIKDTAADGSATVQQVVVTVGVEEGVEVLMDVAEDDPCAPATTVTLSSHVLVGLLGGTLDPMIAMMCGQILVNDLNGLLAFAMAFDFSRPAFDAFAADLTAQATAPGTHPGADPDAADAGAPHVSLPPPPSVAPVPAGATLEASAAAAAQASQVDAARAAERARLVAKARAKAQARRQAAAEARPSTRGEEEEEGEEEWQARRLGLAAAVAASGAVLVASLRAMGRQIDRWAPSEAYEAAKTSVLDMKDRIAANPTLNAIHDSPAMRHLRTIVATYVSAIHVERRAAMVGSLAVAAGARVASALRSTAGVETPDQEARRRAAVDAERARLQAQLADLRAQNAAVRAPQLDHAHLTDIFASLDPDPPQ